MDTQQKKPALGRFVGRLFAGGAVLAAAAAALGGLDARLMEATVSAGLAGIVLGASGYLFGAERSGIAAVALSAAAMFFGLAASQGLVPGLYPADPLAR